MSILTAGCLELIYGILNTDKRLDILLENWQHGHSIDRNYAA